MVDIETEIREISEAIDIVDIPKEVLDIPISETPTIGLDDLDEPEIDKDSDEYFRLLCNSAFKNYRYIIKEEMFFDTQTGLKYTARQFNTVCTGSYPVFRKPKSIEWGKAARAFLEGTFYQGIKGMRSELNATKPAGTVTEHIDGDLVNVYVKRGCGYRSGKVDLFEKLLETLFEYEEDKLLMLRIMKWTCEHAGDPKRRLSFAPFITGIEGNGKSTIIGIISQIIGERYVISPDASTIRGNFSGFLENALVVNINESEEAKNNSLAEKLKPWITDKFLTIQPKGKEAFKVLNTASFLITTNNPNALMQSSGSTRFCNFKTRFDSQAELYEYFGSREEKDKFYSVLYDWLNNKNGYAKINYYLKNKIKYGNFKGSSGRAPYTKSHDAVIALQKTEKMAGLEEAIDELGKVFTLKDLSQSIKDIGATNPSHAERNSVMKSLGFKVVDNTKFFHQVRVSNGSLGRGKMKRLAFPEGMEPIEAAKLYKVFAEEREITI